MYSEINEHFLGTQFSNFATEPLTFTIQVVYSLQFRHQLIELKGNLLQQVNT